MFGKSTQNRKAKGFLRQTLLLLPNFVKLLYRLLGDSRVPLAEKTLLLGVIAYVISPLDFIPDVIPFVGQVDDIYLVSLSLLRLLSRTSSEVLNSHWDGPGDVAVVVEKVATAARYVLPKRVQRVLLGKMTIAPNVKGGILTSPGIRESSPEAENQPIKQAAGQADGQ